MGLSAQDSINDLLQISTICNDRLEPLSKSNHLLPCKTHSYVIWNQCLELNIKNTKEISFFPPILQFLSGALIITYSISLPLFSAHWASLYCPRTISDDVTPKNWPNRSSFPHITHSPPLFFKAQAAPSISYDAF